MPRKSFTVLARIAACALPLALVAPPSPASIVKPGNTYVASMFSVYERNRREDVPNFVTEDLLLASYGLIRVSVGKSLERDRYLPQVRDLATSLAARLDAENADDPETAANRDYLAVLTALIDGQRKVPTVSPRAQAELDLVLAAEEIKASPLWERRMDYTQFVPRGHYQGDEDLERYFRTVRYAGAVLFAIKPSEATGVKRDLAGRMARQAEQLARLIDGDAALAKLHGDLLAEQSWRFGPPEDLSNAALLTVAAEPRATYAERLLAHARAHDMQPRILGGLVDRSRLEEGVTAQDVLTGWRLLPQRRTPDYAAFQRLVFDGTGEFIPVEGATVPFGLTMTDGQAVKGFPLLGELMAAWGSDGFDRLLYEDGEMFFAGYGEAAAHAARELAQADGLAALHQQLMQVALWAVPEPASRLTALRAFWTWQRYASVLYAKQPYTPAGKGLPAPESRTTAWLEPSLTLYQSLLRVVEGHRRFAPHPSWDGFAAIMERIVAVVSRQLLLGKLSEADARFLNGLDVELKALAGAADLPIVVDVHTNAGSGEVLQVATGLAREVGLFDRDQRSALRSRFGRGRTGYAVGEGDSALRAARGARFTQCEFKHPLARRLTDAKWRELLAVGEPPCAGLLIAGLPVEDDA